MRDQFHSSLADFLKVDISNQVTKEFIQKQTQFIKPEWFLEFLEYLGKIETKYKKPLEVFVGACSGFKKQKFAKYYDTLDEKVRLLTNKLKASYGVFFMKCPPKGIVFEDFIDDHSGGNRTRTFSDTELRILKKIGSWDELFEDRGNFYKQVQEIERLYRCEIEHKIKKGDEWLTA